MGFEVIEMYSMAASCLVSLFFPEMSRQALNKTLCFSTGMGRQDTTPPSLKY